MLSVLIPSPEDLEIITVNLMQLVDCPTHVKGNTLDLVLTNTEITLSELSVTEPHSLLPTDH